MKPNDVLSLKAAQKKKRMNTDEFYQWLEQKKIALLYEPPIDKKIIVGSLQYFELLVKGASSEELHLHILRGGINETQTPDEIEYLFIPHSVYKKLLTTGICHISYFREGLQWKEDGLNIISPLFKDKITLNRNLNSIDAIFYLTDRHSSTPILLKISIDDIFVRHDELMSLSDEAAIISTLPTYHYASKKLQIALDTWQEIWRKNFDITNDRNLTERKSINEKNSLAKQCANKKLQELYRSDGYHGEKHKAMDQSIAKLIQPDFALDNSDSWFKSPISDGILSMIKASNLFWLDSKKMYDRNSSRKDVIEFLVKECSLSRTNALHATQIIQPENITRGQQKLNRP